MLRPRIIPCLLLRGQGLVKGVQFKNHRYIGDPINAVQIFNSKEVDEILFLDITATAEGRIPSPDTIQRIADQCLVPFAVGGGIRTVDDAHLLLSAGAEKVCLNTSALENPKLVREIADRFGSQSVMVSIDVKKNFFGKYEVFTHCGSKRVPGSPVEIARLMEDQGVGEILLNSIDRDGTREGYDLGLVRSLSQTSRVPVIACGGAGKLDDFKGALIEGGADAVSAGSFFVFHGRRQAVLISYPAPEELDTIVDAYHLHK